MSTATPPASPEHHPAVTEHLARRAEDVQVRIADAITRFAGSMMFVYVHVAVFAVWMLVFERSPWPTLTLVVSLEAIFLSTFVMIGQNRQATFQQSKADHDFVAQELELHANTEITQAVHALTVAIHAQVVRAATAATTAATAAAESAAAQPGGQVSGSGPAAG
jgi:uncharacterized membrane protein